MRAAVYGWLAASRFFVSQVVLSCTLGETAGRAVHVAERVGPSSARSAPPRLSLNCRLCPDPARVSARCMPISILPTCSGIGKTLPRVRRQLTGTRSLMSIFRSCHTRYYCHLHDRSSKHPPRSTHARRASSKAQPLSPNVPPAQYLWGKCPGSALASRSILSSRVSQDSGVQRRCVPDLRTCHSLLL